jgi:hypothetical protein
MTACINYCTTYVQLSPATTKLLLVVGILYLRPVLKWNFYFRYLAHDLPRHPLWGVVRGSFPTCVDLVGSKSVRRLRDNGACLRNDMSSYHPLPPLVPRNYPQIVTSLSFDPVSDALWAGHASGTVCMYHGLTRVQGVSFVVGRGTPAQKLLLSDNTITACSSSGVGVWGKGGVNKWYHQ